MHHAAEQGLHVSERAHVGWLLLDPDHLSGPRMLVERCLQLGFRPGDTVAPTKRMPTSSSLRLARSTRRLWPILPHADQQAPRVGHAVVGQYVQERVTLQISHRGHRIRVAQHGLGREDDQRLAPLPHNLAPEQMEELSRGRRLGDLDIVLRGKLEGSAPCARWSAPDPDPHTRGATAGPGRREGPTWLRPALRNWSTMICAPLAKSPN